MPQSESTIKLDAALVAAQAEMPAVEFDSTNPFLKNKYASLGAVIQAIRPILAKHGLAFTQFPVSEGGEVGVESTIVHTSGEWRSQKFMLPLGDEKGKSVAQVAGSVITYLRRYALSSMWGLYADEDTDGEKKPQQKEIAPVAAETLSMFDAIKIGVNPKAELEIAQRPDGVGTLARIALLKCLPAETPITNLYALDEGAKRLFKADFDVLREWAGYKRGDPAGDEGYAKLCKDMFGGKAETVGDLLWVWRVMCQLVDGAKLEDVVILYKTNRELDGNAS